MAARAIIMEALANLLHNALHHTALGAKVTVQAGIEPMQAAADELLAIPRDPEESIGRLFAINQKSCWLKV